MIDPMEAPRFQLVCQACFAETDASGRVHFTNILRYVERAEHGFLQSRGVDVFDLSLGGWPRVRVVCDYEKPVRAGDFVTVELVIREIGESSITWDFEILDVQNARIASGNMTTVWVDRMGKACMIPDSTRAMIMEGGREWK